MNRTNYLLVCLIEELAEATKATSKALRFGLDEHHPNGGASNASDIAYELNDIFAIAEMLQANGNLSHVVDVRLRSEKRARVEKYLNEGR